MHLFPYYQPLVYLPNGRIAGYEMLARTYAPARGTNTGAASAAGERQVVSAGAVFGDQTIPVEERIALDRSVRRAGFAAFASDPHAGFLTVNISPDWIDRLDTADASPTMQMIQEAGLELSRVVIEITETAGNPARLRRLVDQYQAGGLRVAIDDFGAGNSQIDRIIALEPDFIKLDMRLFKQASQGGLSADVLIGMMAMAERAGCKIVCEGVETVDEFVFGIECGAHYMQGYLFAPAGPATLDALVFQPQVEHLVGEYFERKCTRLTRTIDQSRAIKDVVLRLREQLQQQVAPDAVPADALRDLGIMRFFICDAKGNQVSPNYEITPEGIDHECRYIGHNWSWRPYFPMLSAMKKRANFDLVASTIYRDASTTRLCKTFGLMLDDARVLLVDAQVSDEVLYAHGHRNQANA